MAVVAVYSLKGGVGKTTLAVNLAWCAAMLSARRTLLWDLDPQAASTFLIGGDVRARDHAQAIFTRDVEATRLVLDCPPGLTETSEQVMRAADLIVVPVIPSPLSARAFDEVAGHLDRMGGKVPLLPVHAMVDRRRTLHRDRLAEHPDWPVIPMASMVETMAARRAPIGAFAPRSAAQRAFAELWQAVERRLARPS